MSPKHKDSPYLYGGEETKVKEVMTVMCHSGKSYTVSYNQMQ